MRHFTSLMLTLAVVGMTTPAFAAEYPHHESADYSPAKTAIFESRTGLEPGSLGSGGQAAKRPAHKVVTYNQLQMRKAIWNAHTGREPGSLTSFLGGNEKPKVRAANADRIFTQWEAEEVSS